MAIVIWFICRRRFLSSANFYFAAKDIEYCYILCFPLNFYSNLDLLEFPLKIIFFCNFKRPVKMSNLCRYIIQWIVKFFTPFEIAAKNLNEIIFLIGPPLHLKFKRRDYFLQTKSLPKQFDEKTSFAYKFCQIILQINFLESSVFLIM